MNGKISLTSSNNPWDWLGEGIYFWEQSPQRAPEHAIESAERKQFKKKGIKTPFVIWATIELGNCLNLVEPESIALLRLAHDELNRTYEEAGKEMPQNKDNNRSFDCAVIQHIQQSRKNNPVLAYETIRCAFYEGPTIYAATTITARNHIQVRVLNPKLIHGYFFPFPVEKYNPYLNMQFVPNKIAF